MARLRPQDWLFLLKAIELGKCTPFLGAGACHGYIPLGAEVAQEWAKTHKYPLKGDANDLAKVSQFVATEYHPLYPKDAMMERLSGVIPPDFSELDEPHGLLADLPLPIYITTNYDDFMFRALVSRSRNPRREICRWNSLLQKRRSELSSGYQPTVAEPSVFHLHGCSDISESMVLTEDDYLSFLVNLGKFKTAQTKLIPSRIEKALTDASLLFLGYRLADWDFRVLFHGLISYLDRTTQRAHISVQLAPGDDRDSAQEKLRAQSYFERYFGDSNIRVYWGTCREFAADLRSAWSSHSCATST